ncbi:MAG: hypothetical protein GQF41_1618 [Candidatus Rifleibacterium amylolyticum]|nr:MAG: hypothetical protein GQF41_1618 [Candidatus Rifleibacterium amylolyticum]
MTKAKQVDMRVVNREELLASYSNHHLVTFNPYEFTLEFNQVDGIVASERLRAGGEDIPITTVAKVVLSHKSMEEFVQTVNRVYADFLRINAK